MSLSIGFWYIGIQKTTGIPGTGCCDLWMMMIGRDLCREKKKGQFPVQLTTFRSRFIKGCVTFLQSWKTANATEMMNEKKDNWSALNALMPKMPRPNGTNVMAFNKTKVKIGMAIFFNFDLRDSLTPLASLNLILKSNSSLCKLRDEMVTLASATGTGIEMSLRVRKAVRLSITSLCERPDRPTNPLFFISTSLNSCEREIDDNCSY